MPYSPPHGTRFRLTKRLAAIKLHAEAIRTSEDEGIAVQIPAGEEVVVDGQKRLTGMRNVFWKDELYAVFEQDLLAHSEQL